MADILIIDDEPDITELLSMELSVKGHNITKCHDGSMAIGRLTQHEYDLVIVDLFMPKKNGLEVAIFIRDMPENNKKTKIIGITGGNGVLPPEKGSHKIGAFVDEVVQKPINYDQFYRRIEKMLVA